MDRLCDEILQLILYELHDPSSFILLSKRFYYFSQDSYTRARYFLTRYGPAHAVFEALGRGKIVNERVLDILMSSGAHLSRYLIQVAMHHYFFTQSHFIKTKWVRSVPLPVFIYFLQLASERYGEIPREKGLDDGSIFSSFLKESRYPPSLRQTSWETIRELLEKYNFIPFSVKDPLMAQFPLVLAIEPRLLPYAVTNGFYMDSKYRDFVFRKMFESIPAANDRTVEDIVQNVRELCRLDPTMFLSRTVAAEICMEAKLNETGYNALKVLDKSGDLLFDLSSLVEELIKLFLMTRSITSANTQGTLRHLYTDFPSSDPVVRLVIIVTVFLSSDNAHTPVPSIKAKLEPLPLGPLTRTDMYNLLIHPFMERFNAVFDYMRAEFESSDEGRKGLNMKEVRAVVEDVAARLLEIDCKGKMLKKLHDMHPSVRDTVVRTVMDNYQLGVDDLPDSEDAKACAGYRAKLCREMGLKPSVDMYFWDGLPRNASSFGSETGPEDSDSMDVISGEGKKLVSSDLGDIGQESLTSMIRQDELLPARSRRRIYLPYLYSSELHLSHVPQDSVQVSKWIKNVFGARSGVTSVFMTHAVVNDNSSVLRYYLHDSASSPVPITFKHFQLLAHLGREVNYTLFVAIQTGAEFFRNEDDYIVKGDLSKTSSRIKTKSKGSRGSISFPQVSVVVEHPSTLLSSNSPCRGRKRPRRSAAAISSYVEPDSDDESLDAEQNYTVEEKMVDQKRKKEVNHLQTWIKHLGDLQKVEQAKLRELKKKLEMSAEPGSKVHVEKNEFLKSLSTSLRSLRKSAQDRRAFFHEFDGEENTDGDDDEYIYRTARPKKRKTRASA